jgi:hypothetical protein
VLPWSDEHRRSDPSTNWIVGTRHEAPGSMQEIPPYAIGRLDFGRGPWSDYAWGVVRLGSRLVPLDVLDLIGSGLHRLCLPRGQPVASAALEEAIRDEVAGERHSRTVGAMGGEAVWRRLVDRRFGLVGCGRTGSLAATNLARLGVRELVLIDPDRVEAHNLGEMDGAYPLDVGRPKVEVLVDELQRIAGLPPIKIHPIVAPIEQSGARLALADCDIIIGAVDHDAPRLVLAWIAAYYHLVLLDLGTGVLRRERAEPGTPDATASAEPSPRGAYPRRMGADVRLIVPGDGCLLCRGGLAGYREALETLVSGVDSIGRDRPAWRRSRAGSLRPLNQLAAAVGTSLLQDLAAERVTGSRWFQLELDDAGNLEVSMDQRQTTGSTPDCLLCSRSGRGDDPIAAN